MGLGDMPFEFEYSFTDSFPGIAVALYVIYLLFTVGIAVAMYVLRCWGMYSIAKRRGIHNPWLAWLPVGDGWILGCISDQFRYVTKGQVKNKRKILLVLYILIYAALVAIFVFLISLLVRLTGVPEELLGNYLTGQLLLTALGTLLAYLVMLAASVAAAILQYMALYDLYASCEPANKVLYLVLNIFFAITLPIFLFLCRNKDLGMPPRREAAQPVQAIPEPWVQEDPEPWKDN